MQERYARAIGLIAAIATLGFAGVAAAADPALERSAAAMRVNDLKSVRYTRRRHRLHVRPGVQAGRAWPKIRLNSFTRTINYDTGAMRDEIVLTRAEALGGGGYPHTGVAAQRAVSCTASFAWNQTAGGPAAGPALRRRPRAPALDHAVWRDQGRAAQQRHGRHARPRRQGR